MNPPVGPKDHGSANPELSPISARKKKAAEAMQKFATVLRRLGISDEEIVAGVAEACANFSECLPKEPSAAIAEMDAAAHALTLWYSDAAYLDSEGRPIVLPARGAHPSLTSLVAQANPEVDFATVLNHLLSQSVLKDEGESRYRPLSRWIQFHGSGDPYHTRSFRTLNAMLGTLVHNGDPQNIPTWYEFYAVNSAVPVSAVPAFDARTRKQANTLLEAIDADLLGLQRSGDEGEPRRCVLFGIYRSEELVESGAECMPQESLLEVASPPAKSEFDSKKKK